MVHEFLPAVERLDRPSIRAAQSERLIPLLEMANQRSPFYRHKFEGLHVERVRRWEDFAGLPFTTKADLVADQVDNPPWGSTLTEPVEHYTRLSQTSSTTGQPLRWVDTNDSWRQMLGCWNTVYRGARVGAGDSIFFAFSFGPFLGFWTAFEAATHMGARAISGGGMSSEQRVAMIEATRPTVVCCTPTYAMRLAEVAEQRGTRLAEYGVRVLIVAGEPGGSIPATRARIEYMWAARLIDHYGLTEVGPVSFECWENPGSPHLNENAFICEVIDPGTSAETLDGERGELILTTLGRSANPLIRYRTGDVVVRRSDPCVCGRTLARIEGGVLSRADDMITVRGVNVYPTAIESVVRGFPEVIEFRSTVSHTSALQRLAIEIELSPGATDADGVATRLAQKLREALGLSVPVNVIAPGALPRFEMKARRFVIEP